MEKEWKLLDKSYNFVYYLTVVKGVCLNGSEKVRNKKAPAPIQALTIAGSGAWLSLVERYVRDVEAAGSNPVAPIY